MSDFKDLVCKHFNAPAATHRVSASCRMLSNMQDREQVACGSLPPVDPALAPLVSPSSSVLGTATCPTKNCRTMDGLLAKLHRAMAVQTRLANTGAIMSLYLRHLSRQVQENLGFSNIVDELQVASSCLSSVMKEQAEAAGSALASFWVARRHLWLSQSRLQQGDRDCFLKLPVDPSAVFGADAAKMLQQAQENRRCAQTVSDNLRRRARGLRRSRPPVPRPTSDPPQWGLGDLRPQLEAFRRRSNRRQGRGGRSAPKARGSLKRPPPS